MLSFAALMRRCDAVFVRASAVPLASGLKVTAQLTVPNQTVPALQLNGRYGWSK
jgi:hypothetical protein